MAATHRQSRTRLFGVWNAIKSRCYNRNVPAYKNYGGRGIKMYGPWRTSFAAFAAYVGQPPFDGATLDRADNSKGYFPGNMRWTTRKAQARNKRNVRQLTIDGVTRSLPAWAEMYGLDSATVRRRILRCGWSPERAVKLPLRQSSALALTCAVCGSPFQRKLCHVRKTTRKPTCSRECGYAIRRMMPRRK